MRRDIPYCLMFTDRTNKTLVVLNRDYQPLGLDSAIESSWYTNWLDYPGATISVDHVQLAVLNQVPDMHDKPGYLPGDVLFYLFDDSTGPYVGVPALRAYKERLAKTFLFLPMNAEDLIDHVQANLAPGEQITTEDRIRFKENYKDINDLLCWEWSMKRKEQAAAEIPDNLTH